VGKAKRAHAVQSERRARCALPTLRVPISDF
jgi:hypothetical protein